MKQILVKIYIKNRIRPIATAILSSEKQLETFKAELNGAGEIIDFYNIIINRSEFLYATIKEINK